MEEHIASIFTLKIVAMHSSEIFEPTYKTTLKNRGSSVSIVSDYRLDDRGSIPDIGRGFFF
jgi:hypothetical protein